VTSHFALVRITPATTYLDVDAFAKASGLHPDLVDRFVALGLLEPLRDTGGRLWFRPADLTAVARIQRLRAGFGINYAALGLVLDLLDRLEERGPSRREGGPWTSTH
jgi:DNA-binding transcriptional MerR regulator